MVTNVTRMPITKFGNIAIRKASESDPWGVCLALYGPPGVGKTTAAGKISLVSEGSPVLFLDAEGGTRSISHLNKCDVAQVGTWPELVSVSQQIMAQKKDCQWKTIVIDNMSEIQAINVKSIVGDRIPQIQDWGKTTADMLNFTRLWRDFARFNSVNVILIAWASPSKEEFNGIEITKQDVAFTPSLARQFPGIVDIVGHLTVEQNQTRTLSFAPSNRTAAKFRRSGDENAVKIPLIIKFGEQHNPLGDIITTLRTGTPWPAEKYAIKEQPK